MVITASKAVLIVAKVVRHVTDLLSLCALPVT